MSSIRNQIIAAAVAALNAATDQQGRARPAGIPTADRLRMEPYQMADLPAIVVMPVREEVEPLKNGRWGPLVVRTMTMRIACYAAGSQVDALLDPLLTWADAALDGNLFGGLVNDCLPGLIEWQYADEDQQYGVALADYRVMYTTRRADATAAT